MVDAHKTIVLLDTDWQIDLFHLIDVVNINVINIIAPITSTTV